VCRSIWYQFYSGTSCLARNRTQLCSRTETVRHVTRTVQCDWPESCFGERICDKLVSKLFVQISTTRRLVPVSGANVAGIKLNLLTKSQHYSTCLKGIVSLTTVLYARLYREACLTQYVNRNTDRILWPTQAAWAVWIHQQLLQPTWHSLTTARMVNLTLTINSITWLKQ